MFNAVQMDDAAAMLEFTDDDDISAVVITRELWEREPALERGRELT